MQPEQVLQQQLEIFGDLLPSYSNSKDHQAGVAPSGMEVDAEQKKRKLAEGLEQLLSKQTGEATESKGWAKTKSSQAGGKAKGKGKGKKGQMGGGDVQEVIKLLASITLQQADHLARVQMDTGFVLTMRNDQQPECMLPILIKASTQWRTTWSEQPAEVNKSLRTTLITLLLTELGSRAQLAQGKPETIAKMTATGWMERDEWLYQRWNPAKEELEKDDSRKPLSQASFIEQVQQALRLVVEPTNLMRFQASRRLTADMKGPTVTFLLDTGLRSQSDELHRLLKGWEGLAAWQLVAARLRQQRLKRGPAVEHLSKWLAEH